LRQAQAYRLCADGAGKKGETDLIGHFHTIGVPSSERYTPQLYKIHAELYNAIWLRYKKRSDEERGIFINQIENALSNARAMALEVRNLLCQYTVQRHTRGQFPVAPLSRCVYLRPYYLRPQEDGVS
jgi:hypothetical protein